MRPSALAAAYAAAKRGDGGFECEQVRDITKVTLDEDFSLVVAVDSDGGIGSREGDAVGVAEYVLGRFAVRVPLMEIVACGAVPIAAFDMLTVPMDGLAREIVRGVRDELLAAGLRADFPLSGSSEDNVPIISTGIAVTIAGLVHREDFRPGRSSPGDTVLCLGVPKSAPGDEVSLDDGEIVRPELIKAALMLEGVRDVLPVGSRGVWYEAAEMAKSAGLEFVRSGTAAVDGRKSAGPSTCALISVSGGAVSAVADAVTVPVCEVGHLAGRR